LSAVYVTAGHAGHGQRAGREQAAQIAIASFADIAEIVLAAARVLHPPRIMARTPHGYHDVERIRAELNAAEIRGYFNRCGG
jgi:hypothetical protein